ncbi:MAG TPA: hypothetical protein ENH91_10980 [Leeuwenhoekiella sp.]|nr:hypothetical protein [Leeuwenhoekiella sp.]
MKLIYFLYLLKSTEYPKLWEYITYVAKLKKQSKGKTILQLLSSFAKYNTAFLDYFYLEFYNKSDQETSAYASTLLMHKFHSQLNDKNFIKYFRNKKLFYNQFAPYIKHAYFIPEKKQPEDLKKWLMETSPNAIMAKKSNGQAGLGIEKLTVSIENGQYLVGGMSLKSFYNYAQKKEYDLWDTYITQHSTINEISPDALSTIRVISVIDLQGNVEILGAMIRMSTGSFVDNFHKGGVSAAVDLKTGELLPPMLFQDPRKSKKLTTHPVSQKKMVGFFVPFWNQVIPMVKQAAKVIPQVRTVGWDVIITEKGPSLLEGNDNWDKTHYEKIKGNGLKNRINSFLTSI